MDALIEAQARHLERIGARPSSALGFVRQASPREGENGQAWVLAALFLLLLPVLVLIWIGFALSHWLLGWGFLALVIAGLAAAAQLRPDAAEDSVGALPADREPLLESLRDLGIAALGTIAGIVLLILIILLLHVIGGR